VWWFGRLIANGRTGIFPGSYVQTATAAPATAAAAAAAAEPPPVQTAAAAVPTVPVVAATPDNKRLSTSFGTTNPSLLPCQSTHWPTHRFLVNHPVTRFLTSMDLDEYVTSFLEKGFDDMDILEELTEADLDVIGVVPLEHRRRIMNAVSASRLRSVSEPVERVRSPSLAVDNTPVPVRSPSIYLHGPLIYVVVATGWPACQGRCQHAVHRVVVVVVVTSGRGSIATRYRFKRAVDFTALVVVVGCTRFRPGCGLAKGQASGRAQDWMALQAGPGQQGLEEALDRAGKRRGALLQERKGAFCLFYPVLVC